jgi:hypothetical protein
MTNNKFLANIAYSVSNNGVCIGKETLTVDSTVKSLVSVPTGVSYAIMWVESNATGTAIRYWESGDDPSTTDGIGKSNNEAMDVANAENLRKFRVVQAQAGTHKLFIQYYKI